MDWNEVLRDVTTVECVASPVIVANVQYDSRRVQHGDVFVAMRGGSVDGNQFVEKAVAAGAAAIITDSRDAFAALRGKNLGLALVEHGRRALAEASSAIFNHPQSHLALSGVTGTNGKTTTAFLLEAMLRSVGRKCVLIGTIETHVAGEVRESLHTTPESRDILELFADGVRAGATEAVMEMSSHALEQERVWGLPVEVAIFTNLTQDHLDYHRTMEAYFAAKSRLFEGVGTPPPRVAVLNTDDPYGERLAKTIERSQVIRYGVDAKADFAAESIQMLAGETRFRMITPAGVAEIRSPLTGRVNVYNLLAASAGAWSRGLKLDEIVCAAEAGAQVPGRFEVVPSKNGITVVVDYAHTDDALRNLISLARDLQKGNRGHVITLFGCGGDRDRTKRPRMGRAAGEGSDLVVLTSDNPRSEDPAAIIAEALVGVKETGTECIVEEDRAKAIEVAIHAAHPGDIVLIAGKGHEKVQLLKSGPVPFDDMAVAARVLKEME
ncbi:UDP-N-acetylmuramoyl-L-alanyl-D-glutamate--2,6-diaminopimelate ligase [Edaphobacter flagellatus]|uniref:UDP-N-acetylmuramoyl-L-alanyl-D-glutamate--2, 6-diaminopimelate ligase n=1 Tax=Edaphobacter flagellatus TaxID=1933044 RepID=UPI0021B2B765|nr:UDP-N-acetylmuramoyl-L-alanyl-D-glutamate--2,6-diaminopimelate ligase [Edaphobacter flagellatus]